MDYFSVLCQVQPQVDLQKGDGNDGEPDACQKLEMEKKAKNWLELKNYGWFGMIFEIIRLKLLLFTALYKPYCTLHFIKKEKKNFQAPKIFGTSQCWIKVSVC